MPTLPQTRSKHLIPFSAFLRKAGTPVDRILLKASLPTGCLDDPEALVPSDAAFRFRELAARTLGLPNISIDATRHLAISDLGEFSRPLFQAPTLYKLLTEFRDRINTETTMAVIELNHTECGDVSFCHRFQHKPTSDLWHSDLYILQWTIKLVRLVDPAWSPMEIWSVSPNASDHDDAIAKLGAKTAIFNRHCTGFLIPSSMLALPLTSDNVTTDAEQVDDSQLRATAPANTCSGALRQMIMSYAGDRWLSIDETGEVLGLSVRTLQRRLAAERTTYSNVLNGTRSEMASELLEKTDTTIEDIAEHLGYRSPGNFSRAFRCWSGASPREFRQQRSSR